MPEAESVSADPVWLKSYPPGIDWSMAIEDRPLYALLDDAVARFGDRVCADFMDKTFTYREIGDLVDRAAKGFQAMGIGPGSRVGLFLPNCPYYVIAYFAVLKAGATVVNFNPLYAEREVAQQIEDSGTEVMVTLDLAQLYDKLARMLGETGLKRIVVCRMAGVLPFPKNLLFPLVKRREVARIPRDDRHIRFEDLTANDGRVTPAKVGPDDLAILQYTGGTTGIPKGAMLSHRNVYANALQSTAWFPDAEPGREVMLGVLPFFHVFAMTAVMNLSIRIGATIIMMPRFNLEEVMKTIDRKKPTLFPAVPTIYTAINMHRHRGRYDLSSIKFCLSGGAPLPVEVKNEFEALTGCRLVEGYGLSEASPVVTCNPVSGAGRAGSIGLPLPGTVVEVVSLDDPLRLLGQGEKGEICVRGPQVMLGYWRNEEETQRALAGGRLHTGDVGYVDEDGYAYIVDRIKDLILAGGYNIYPRNVEEAIYLHPCVAECVVAGIPDPYRGQTVKAYIKLKDGVSLTRDELTAFLADKLSPIEMPKQVEFRDTLPKTMIGKLSRKALLEEEEQRRLRQGEARTG